MKKDLVKAALLTAALIIVVPSFMRGQVADFNKTENSIKGFFKKKNKAPQPDSAASSPTSSAPATSTPAASASSGSGPQTLTTYANYDFVPGEQVVFEDHFTDDQDGEFPAHWHLNKGQGVINKVAGDPAFFLTQGNYVEVAPRMKTQKDYLPDNFSGEYPGDRSDAHYFGRWHHAAMIKKGDQIKCYEDQYRVLVIPECEDCKMSYVEVGGIGDIDHPVVFRNFRIAQGGNMNLIGQKFTDAKIITHGINFDVDKAIASTPAGSPPKDSATPNP